MKKTLLSCLIFFIGIQFALVAAELYGYVKSLELDEETYQRYICLDENKPVRDEDGNLVTDIPLLRVESYSGTDILNTLLTACAHNWGVKLKTATVSDIIRVNYIKAPYPMAAVPLKGLVAEYLFNGDAADTSGNGNDGVLYGNIRSNAGRFNIPGSAFEFDGIDDYIEIPDAPCLRPEGGNWSIALWFQAENRAQLGVIIGKRQNASPFESYGLNLGTDAHVPQAGRTLLFVYRESAGSIERSGVTNANVVDGNWHHVVFTADNRKNSLKIYIDNTSKAITIQYNAGTWPVINNPDALLIGCSSFGGNSFKGAIENIRIYNTALTPEDVNALYNETGDSF